MDSAQDGTAKNPAAGDTNAHRKTVERSMDAKGLKPMASKPRRLVARREQLGRHRTVIGRLRRRNPNNSSRAASVDNVGQQYSNVVCSTRERKQAYGS